MRTCFSNKESIVKLISDWKPLPLTRPTRLYSLRWHAKSVKLPCSLKLQASPEYASHLSRHRSRSDEHEYFQSFSLVSVPLCSLAQSNAKKFENTIPLRYAFTRLRRTRFLVSLFVCLCSPKDRFCQILMRCRWILEDI